MMNNQIVIGKWVMRFALVALAVAAGGTVLATSQWTRKFDIPCSTCHTVFPRLNSYGEDFLRGGYQMGADQAASGEDDVFIEQVENLFGFRINMTPVQMETNALVEDSAEEPTTRWTLGSPIWLQMFVAGSIYKDISFFSELEHSSGAFKFNWFYFNFTNLAQSRGLNFQIGNISPLEFASFPNRLPQLPVLKSEVMLLKTSGGNGEESVDLSSARPGVQYYGYNDWGLLYGGLTPGTRATDVNQFLHYWVGAVLRLNESMSRDLAGTSATLHYYAGTDTKYTGEERAGDDTAQVENEFTRISPQVNIRYREKLDIQAAYVFAKDDNRSLVSSPTGDFKYHGIGFEGGFMPTSRWHIGLHYDWYESDNELTSGAYTGEPVLQYERIVPTVTYVINQNLRFTLYFEKDLSDKRGRELTDRLQVNLRTMF